MPFTLYAVVPDALGVVFVLSAMTAGLAGVDVLFTDVWPATDDDPWYVFALRATVGTATFVAIGGIPVVVATAAPTTVLAVLTAVFVPVTAVAFRHVFRV